MSETVKVIRYDKNLDAHLCEDRDGKTRSIDLIVGGCLPVDLHPDSIVGKTVRFESTFPYVEIANDVEIITNEQPGD